MIKVIVSCGFGNQMFQYASAYGMAKHNNTTIASILYDPAKCGESGFELYKFDLPERIRKYYSWGGITLVHYLARIHNKIQTGFNYKYLIESNDDWGVLNQETIKNVDWHVLRGYWQNYKYFDDYRKDIWERFTPQDRYIAKCEKYLDVMTDPTTVCIHYRDYGMGGLDVTNGEFADVNDQYYLDALDKISHLVSIKNVYVFCPPKSEQKCSSCFSGRNIKFANNELNELDDFQQWYLLSQCPNVIIANSTWSWWAAYMHFDHKNIICPIFKNWTEDYYPVEWQRLVINSL